MSDGDFEIDVKLKLQISNALCKSSWYKNYWQSYYQLHRNKSIEYSKRYSKLNREKIREYYKKYYQKNKEKIQRLVIENKKKRNFDSKAYQKQNYHKKRNHCNLICLQLLILVLLRLIYLSITKLRNKSINNTAHQHIGACCWSSATKKQWTCFKNLLMKGIKVRELVLPVGCEKNGDQTMGVFHIHTKIAFTAPQ
jgi:hypothetical protein